ncbi:A/G-specific adenine glycosylase [Treponema brennaborense]|uniref:Adenine DNA glycosylase n=1 Tax=Treponema brennaborense (strain DSM 12168 / CIP 105900 / DD5/3) TaxID=906968 RepID=F4LP90_TREBD|nr:A/G-specific adenine glycosylase [Treponema brennaborense]AEE16952.1 HhH-GPD family protein [Treponema brennaborense DSM 12168]
MLSLSAARVSDFQQTILDQYRQSGRSFPWRETSDPYRILVSEIMLQQTQTERVLPKYEAWLERFPTARSLADASLADALGLWNGLGYNRRARFLQEACRAVCSSYGGVFPRTADELDALPGIGPYTARAVCTFAYGTPEVFIETNIRSVYIFFFFTAARDSAVSDKELLPIIDRTLYRADPRTWYYALMDYGAVLKKKVVNPNRRSAHYTKQSKFEGSLRQARGAVLRCLTAARAEAPSDRTANHAVSLEYIAETERIDVPRIRQAAESLLAERLIVCENGAYRVSDT